MFNRASQRDLGANWTLAIFTFLQLLDFIDRSILLSMLTPIKTEFGLKDGQIGDINAAFMFGYMIFSPVFAYFGDRMTRKYLIVAGVLIWSMGTVAGGWAAGILGLMVARFFVSLGEASFGAIGASVISDKFAGPRRNSALSIFYATIPIGYALGFILGDVLHQSVGWRSTLGWVGAPGLFAALILLPFKEPERGALDQNEPGKVGHGSMDFGDLKNFWKLRYFQIALTVSAIVLIAINVSGAAAYLGEMIFGDYGFSNPAAVFSLLFGVASVMFVFFIRQMVPLLKNRAYMMVCLGYCAYTAAVGAYSVWGPQFLERVHGVKDAGSAFGIITLAGAIPGTLIGGFWASRLRAKYSNAYALLIGLSVLAAAPVVAAALLAPSLLAVKMLMVLAIFLIFASTGPANTLIIETVPVHLRCMAMAGSIFLIHILGDLWSPSIVGRVSDATGGNLTLALMLLPVFLVIAATFWLKLAWSQRRDSGSLDDAIPGTVSVEV